jgi:predicted nucleic acid-binding protein
MVIDASVWVAALLRNDRHHEESASLLHTLLQRNQQAAVPLLAWPEIAGAIARKTGNSELAKIAVAFLNKQAWLESVPLDSSIARRATTVAAEQRLRGADAVYVALVLQRNGVLITLDLEMLQRVPIAVITRTPRDWLNGA